MVILILPPRELRWHLRYASLKLMPRFGTPFRNVFAARLRRKPEGFFWKSEGFFWESESFFRESEGFFRRALGSYTHKFPKRGAASLTYLLRSRLDLPRSRLGLPRLRLSRNSGPTTEGFSNHGIKFKDAYCTHTQPSACRRLCYGPSVPSLEPTTTTAIRPAEHCNRLCKTAVHALGANITPKALTRIGKVSGPLLNVIHQYDSSCFIQSPLTAHTATSYEKDLKLLLKEITEHAKVFDYTPGRNMKSIEEIGLETCSAMDGRTFWETYNVNVN